MFQLKISRILYKGAEMSDTIKQIQPLQIEYCGKQGEWDLLKLTYPVDLLYANGSNVKNSYKKAIIIKVRPENLYDTPLSGEVAHYILRPKK